MTDSDLAVKNPGVSNTGPDAAEQPDLALESEAFEVTPALVAANLSFGGNDVVHLPDEMFGAVERIWRDRDFTWPTTLTVIRITLSVEPDADPGAPQQVRSRVSVLGTGFSSDQPVLLSWGNAFGFPDATIPLPEAQADEGGFFGVDLLLKTVPKRHSQFVWEFENQLVLIAQQIGPDGAILRRAEQRGIPPHVVWQWAR